MPYKFNPFTGALDLVNAGSSITTGNLTDAGTDGITVTGGTGAVVGSGTSLAQHVADTTHNGYLSSTDWNTFNAKQAALTPGSISTSTTGVSVASGASSTVGPNVTVNVQTASGSQPGLLSSADWTTFNNKQNAVTWAKENHTFVTSETHFDLGHLILGSSLDVALNGILQEEASDYTLSTVGGVTRVTYAGTMASTIANGDRLNFKYQY